MKMLLIEPAKAPTTLGGEDFVIYEPLALEYVAAGVAKDHQVKILDLRLESNLSRVLHEFSPDPVARDTGSVARVDPVVDRAEKRVPGL